MSEYGTKFIEMNDSNVIKELDILGFKVPALCVMKYIVVAF